jgi:LysM repeat protein
MSTRDNQTEENFTFSDADDQSASIDPQEEAYLRGQTAVSSSSTKWRLAVAGVVVLLLIVLVMSFFRGGNSGSAEKLAALENRIAQIEEKLAKMDWIEKSVTRIGAQEQNFGMLSERVERFEAGVKQELNEISRQIKALREQPPAKPPAVESAAPKTTAAKTHSVKSGETLYSISRKYDLSVDRLRSLNGLAASDTIYPGQKLVVAPKQ